MVDFTVSGTIGGHQVSGKTTSTSFSVPCAGAGADQVLAVHWLGNVDQTRLQGEIDFKPGTWTLGSSQAQGTASLGVVGGKSYDSLAATAGTVTTGPAGGSINATFTGTSTVHVSGTWTCPSG